MQSLIGNDYVYMTIYSTPPFVLHIVITVVSCFLSIIIVYCFKCLFYVRVASVLCTVYIVMTTFATYVLCIMHILIVHLSPMQRYGSTYVRMYAAVGFLVQKYLCKNFPMYCKHTHMHAGTHTHTHTHAHTHTHTPHTPHHTHTHTHTHTHMYT